MFHKITHLLAVLVCLTLVIPALSCAEGQSPFNKRLELQLDKAPRLNEPVELNCIRRTSDFVTPGQERNAGDKPKHEKITLEIERIDPKTRLVVEVPTQDVLVGGNLDWEGDMTGKPMNFSATIKFPYEGNWRICARSTYHYDDSDCVFLNVAEDSGTFGFKEDYAPPAWCGDTPSELCPIIVEFDISKPSRLDEPFQITWGISTIRDIAEAVGEVEFYRMEGTDRISMPIEEVLIEGDLTWNGSLKKDSPIYFSATVKLPQKGDWEIRATSTYYTEEQVPINSGCVLYLHVDKDKGRWGWAESHEKPLQGPPPLPNR
jgi:hypothetical protein